jgi:hypothetical protein
VDQAVDEEKTAVFQKLWFHMLSSAGRGVNGEYKKYKITLSRKGD